MKSMLVTELVYYFNLCLSKFSKYLKRINNYVYYSRYFGARTCYIFLF